MNLQCEIDVKSNGLAIKYDKQEKAALLQQHEINQLHLTSITQEHQMQLENIDKENEKSIALLLKNQNFKSQKEMKQKETEMNALHDQILKETVQEHQTKHLVEMTQNIEQAVEHSTQELLQTLETKHMQETTRFKKEHESNIQNGKYSKRRRSNVAVIIDRIVFIGPFLFYCLLCNHSFQTNPNRITYCFKLLSLYLQLTTTLLLRRYFDF